MPQRRLLQVLITLVTALTIATGCSPAAGTPAVEGRSDTSGPADAVALTVIGDVRNKLALSFADVGALEVVQRTIEHPKDGDQSYTGVMMSTLLAEAEPSDDATLTFTASDAYSVEVPVSEAEACADCMVAFDGGTLRLCMPGFGSSFWVKDVVSIEAK